MGTIRKLMLVLVCFIAAGLPAAKAETPAENGQAAEADPIGAEIQKQVGELNLSGWDAVYGATGAKGAFGISGINQMITELASGQNVLSVEGFLNALGQMAVRQLSSQLFLVVQLVAVALLSGILSNLKSGFGGKLGDIGGFACYALSIGVIIAAFSSAAQAGRETIDMLVKFMQLVFPALLTLLTAIGSAATAAAFRPVMALLTGSVGTVFMNLVLPLILACGALAIVSRLGERETLSKLGKLLKDCCKWLIGILTTVYVGIVSLQGLTTGTFDGVSVRTAKYALNNFVPVAGKMVADTVDTVLGCSLLVKNALGVTSIVLTALILLSPLLQIVGCIFAFRLAAALCQPVAIDKLPSMIGAMADVMGMLFGAVLAVGAMFMITIGLLISAGNAAVMIR